MAEENEDVVELPRTGDAAFSTLMDTLVADEAEAPAAEETGSGEQEAPAGAPDSDGAAEAGEPAGGEAGADTGADTDAASHTDTGATADTGAEAEAGDAGSPDADAGGEGGAGEGEAEPDSGDRAAPRVTPTFTTDQLRQLPRAFETAMTQAFQQQALQSVRQEHEQYFQALERHPRLLVGLEVPSLNGEEGEMERLRDAQDAQDWQNAVKSLLTDEVRERATAAMEQNRGVIDTVHSSIELFNNNSDLVPGTKQFNKRLADRFAAMAKPYELRVEGKLYGWNIPVQPLIEKLREELKSQPAPAAKPAAKAKPKPKPDPPQQGLRSKAGAGADDEDYSTLFGTLGLPNLRI